MLMYELQPHREFNLFSLVFYLNRALLYSHTRTTTKNCKQHIKTKGFQYSGLTKSLLKAIFKNGHYLGLNQPFFQIHK